MNLVESIERSLDWLSTPKHLPGRLEMQTQRGKHLETETVSLAIRVPIAGGAMLRIPVFMRVMPIGSSPIQHSHARSERVGLRPAAPPASPAPTPTAPTPP